MKDKNMKFKLMIFLILLALVSCEKADDFDTNFFVETTVVFEGNASTEWNELDISKAVGKNFAQATLKIYNQEIHTGLMAYFRQKGDESDYMFGSNTENMVSLGSFGVGQTIIHTDDNGVIEWKADSDVLAKIEVIAFVK